MNYLSLILSRRWLGYLGVAIVFAVVCVFLSHWQADRTAEKEALQSRVDANYDAEPVAIDELLGSLDSFDVDDEYRRVTMTGTYLVDEQVLVRNRPRSGNPGFEVVTPLRLDDGTVFMVDRGWVPTGNEQDLPDSVPAPPEGEVTVTVRLKAGEDPIPGRSAANGQIATIDLDDLAGRVGEPAYTAAYGLMTDEDPAPAETRPAEALMPEINIGMHISYAIQWILFAVMAFAFLAYAVRREYLHLHPDAEAAVEARREARLRRRPRSRSDADVEDELLDRVG